MNSSKSTKSKSTSDKQPASGEDAESRIPSARTLIAEARAALPATKDFALSELRELPVKILAGMDPRLQVACARARMNVGMRAISSAARDEVAVIARVKDVTAWQALSEVRPGATLGMAEDGTTLVTGRIPVARVEAVRKQPFVASLKASQPLRRTLAATVREMACGPDALPAGTVPKGGAGVVIGIVDFGCDFAHRNFRTATGATRLLAIWDQGGTATANSPFGYGRLHTAKAINAALKSADPYKKLGYGPEKLPAGDGTHGTHVMDIAGGNGRGSGTPGCAPAADLIFVESSSADIAWDGPESTTQSFGDSVQMLEAVKFIFDQAGDRPCVVNLSLATNGGPHDGTTLVEQGLDALVREKPNRAVVIAAANCYADGIHAAGTVPKTGTFDLKWQSDLGQLDRELEVWLPGSAKVAAELFGPDGKSLGIAEPGSNLSLGSGNKIAIFISNRLAEPNNGDNTISAFIAGGVDGGDWKLRLRSRNKKAAPFHAWIERQDDDQSHFAEPHDNSHTIGSISCGRECIAVGSWDAHKADQPLSWFSSAGPTRDGRQKPEISAPGHDVRAARSRSATGTVLMSGTSMAAPAVTGLVALMLAEAKRRGLKLTNAQIRGALISTARRNPPAGTAWHDRYGFGRAHSNALKLKAAPATPAKTKKPKPPKGVRKNAAKKKGAG